MKFFDQTGFEAGQKGCLQIRQRFDFATHHLREHGIRSSWGCVNAVGPTFNGLRSQIGAELESALGKTKFLIEQKLDELNASEYAAQLTCLGNAFVAYSLVGGPQMQLDGAVVVYQIALGHVTVDGDSIVWRIIKNQIGEGKRRLGFKTSATGLHSNYGAIKTCCVPFDWV
jgi:hypothetical protein